MSRGLRIAHLLHPCRTLGPGARGVIWVRGCRRRCPGCIAAPILDAGADPGIAVDGLAERVISWRDIEGLTFSGGEPFEQADALADLCVAVRRMRPDLSLMAYSGYTLGELRAEPEPGALRLLDLLDLLVDGPFVAGARADRLWRGSANQQVHFLSGRHREFAAALEGPGAGVELHVDAGGEVFWAGVPLPGLAEALDDAARERGFVLRATERMWT